MVRDMARPFRFAIQGRDLGDHEALVALAQQVESLGHDELLIGSVEQVVDALAGR